MGSRILLLLRKMQEKIDASVIPKADFHFIILGYYYILFFHPKFKLGFIQKKTINYFCSMIPRHSIFISCSIGALLGSM
jgi:hypothetical protein